MNEIWELSTLPYMLPVTITLVVLVVFVLVSIVFGIGGEGIDLDMDGDIDLEVSSGSFLDTFFSFVNADKIPTVIVLSVLSLTTWFVSLISSYLLNPNHSNMLGSLIVIGSLVVGLVLTRYIVTPLIPFFKWMKSGENNGEVPEGKQAFVKSEELTESYGQVEYRGEEGPVRLNAKLREGESKLKKGDSVVVLGRAENSKFYYVAKLKI